MSKNVAEQITEMLYAAGVRRIYAVAGDSLNYLNDAIRRDGRIKWIHVRHEEAGAFAAAAESELEGLACCAGSSGPGHVHLINGLYDAHRSGLPVIAIASTIDTTEFGTEYFQETDTMKLFSDCSHYNQIATTPAQVPRMLQTAIQHAVHKKGVAVFGLPGDLGEMKADESTASMEFYFPESVITPVAADLQKAAALLNEAKKVAVFCGIGCKDAHPELIRLAELLKSPVGYSYRGKMHVQYDNPYEVGMTGLLGVPSAFHAMHEADLVLLLGTDFPYVNFMPVKNKIIQIDEKPERLGRRAKADLGLAGKIKHTLQALLPMIEAKTDDSFLKAQLSLYDEVKENLNIYVKDRGSKDKISPEYVASVINKEATADAIFTVDTGMSSVWGARYLHATGKRSLLGSFNHGSMANAMPMAMGAALAQPSRQVIALCGDGGLSMLSGDLATIRQYNLPVKIIVFNNRVLGMVKLEMEVAGLIDNETDMFNPDFEMLAGAYGIKGITVRKPDEVEAAVSAAFNTDGPVLLNIMTNPESLAMPPKVELKQMKGYALFMGKLILSGKMTEALDVVKTNYKHLGELL